MKYLFIFIISISLSKISYAKNVKENTKNYYLNGSIVVWNDRFIDRPNGQVEKWTFFEDKTYKITIHKNNKINKFWQKNYFSTIKEAVQNLPYLIDEENSFLKESGTYKLGGFPKKWLNLSQRSGLQYQIDDDELMEAVNGSLNKTYTFKYYPNSEIENYRIVKKRKQEEKQAQLEKQKLEAKKKKLEEEERKKRVLAQQKKTNYKEFDLNKKKLFQDLVKNTFHLRKIDEFDHALNQWKKVNVKEVEIYNFTKLSNPSYTEFRGTITAKGDENSFYWQPIGKNHFRLRNVLSKKSPWIYEIDLKNNIVQHVCEKERVCFRYEILFRGKEKIIAAKELEKANLKKTRIRERIIDDQINKNKTGFDIIYYTSLGISKNGIWGIECFYGSKPSITLKAPSSSGPLPSCPK